MSAGTAPVNRDRPLYATGNTVHAQVSVIYPLTSGALWEGGSVSAEIGGLYRTAITRNAANIDPAKDRGAWGFSVRFSPSYFQVLPGLDLNVPVSLSYNPKGKSPVSGALSGHQAGSFSIALSAEYLKAWNANLQYTTVYCTAKS